MLTNLSLRTKIFMLVVFSVTMITLPVIIMTYGNLKRISRQFEEKSFGNVMYLIEDNINFRYLNLVSTEVMTVLERKIHLQTTALLAKNTWKDLAWLEASKREEIFSRWGNTLHNLKTFSALFECGKLKTKSLYPQVLMENVDRTSYKGMPLSKMINPETLASEGTFAVFTLSGNDCKQLKKYEHCELENFSLLLYCLPLDKDYVIMFGSVLADIKQNGQITEQGIIDSMQEKFDSLALYPNSIIGLFSGSSSSLLASKGNIKKENINDIPQYMLDIARKEKFAHFYYKDDEIPDNSYFKDWGDTIIRLSYFKALDWYVIAAVPLAEIEGHSEHILYRLVVLASIVVAICALLGLLLAYRIITPLQLLIKKVLGLAQADFDNFIDQEKESQNSGQKVLAKFTQDLPITRTDEVGQLASAFSKMGHALEQNIQNLLITQATAQKIQAELNAARDIQRGILRKSESAPQTENFAVNAFLEPAKEVGGDLYDFFTLPNGKQVVVIGDVAGKGIAAALFMSMTVTLIRYAMTSGLNPAMAMQKINDTLSENNPRCMFVTLFIGLFDEQTGLFEFANGGHCYPYLINQENKKIQRIETLSGPLVGGIENIKYTLSSIQLHENDMCFLYTDGITEAMNEKNEFYGEKRLQQAFFAINEQDIDQILNELYNDVVAFRGKAVQSDDITMLLFKWKRK